MLVKMNGKPIRVSEKDDKNKVDWFYLSGYGVLCTLVLYFVDSLCLSFSSSHVFPFMKYVGEVIRWIGNIF